MVQTEPIAAWLHHHAGCRRLVVIANAVQHPLPVLGPSPAGPAAAIHQLGPEDCTPAGRLLLLAAGTKPYTKGFDLLLEAFVAIAPRHPDWDLAIVGLHPDHSEAGLSAAGLSARVHCPGPVADMAAWYARADCFVLSSRFEGIPNVLLEAMAAGCVCLAAVPPWLPAPPTCAPASPQMACCSSGARPWPSPRRQLALASASRCPPQTPPHQPTGKQQSKQRCPL